MNETTLDVTVANFVACVTSDVPPVNALTRELDDALTDTFDRYPRPATRLVACGILEKRPPSFTDR